MTKHYQNVIIGAGHNGLVCAAYLAKAGQSVLIIEANEFLGGAASTQEFHPGFRASRAAHLLNGFPTTLIDDLQLQRHGLQFSNRNMSTFSLSTTAAALQISAETLNNLTAECNADRERYQEFVQQMDRFASVLQLLNDSAPSKAIPDTWAERWQLLKVGIKLRLLGKHDMREFLRIAGMNVYDLLEEKFNSSALKGALALDAILGAEHGPRSPGTVLNYLQRWALLRSSNLGLAQVKGGIGALSTAIANSARQAGADIRLGTRVKRVLVKNDCATGVELENGECISADRVISNADPKTSFLKLLGVRHLDTGFVRRVDHYRCKGLTAKLHLALADLPRFNHLASEALNHRLLIAPSLNYVELAFNPSKYGELPAAPVMEIVLPSVSDESLAPKGQHVLSAIVQFVPLDIRDGNAQVREQFIQTLLQLLEQYAPGIRQLVRHAELLLPQDIAEQFHIHGGHWHHGALSFDQFYFTRPVPGAAQYQSPVSGFYLCGAGNHPGGGVHGLAGYLAAQRLLRDRIKQSHTVTAGAA